jgi:hypothetical protein
MIRFRFQPRKAQDAICWMLSQQDGLDFHTILKTAYFADKHLLNAHGRPVFGARYKAMNYGPVPVEIYEMLKEEPYWLSELRQEEYPWERAGSYHVRLRAPVRNAPPRHLSALDMQALEQAFEQCRNMDFDERTRETHDFAWLRGIERAGGWMDYADMIGPEREGRAELIAELEKLGPRIEL